MRPVKNEFVTSTIVYKSTSRSRCPSALALNKSEDRKNLNQFLKCKIARKGKTSIYQFLFFTHYKLSSSIVQLNIVASSSLPNDTLLPKSSPSHPIITYLLSKKLPSSARLPGRSLLARHIRQTFLQNPIDTSPVMYYCTK